MQGMLFNGTHLSNTKIYIPEFLYEILGWGGKYARIDHVNVPNANRFQMIYIGSPTATISGRQAPSASCLMLIHCKVRKGQASHWCTSQQGGLGRKSQTSEA